MVFVLKDEVKKRATWTGNDSLNANVGGATMVPSPVLAPSPATLGRDHRQLAIGVDPLDTMTKRDGYLEMQVWGGLPLSDVEEVLFPGSAPTAAKRKLKELGIPFAEGVQTKG